MATPATLPDPLPDAARVPVQDARGESLSPCSLEKARKRVADGQAEWVSTDPPNLRLLRDVARPAQPPAGEPANHAGESILVHICCAPCSTYTLRRLTEIGFRATGFWYNPNIHPWEEHERRRASLAGYAEQIGLPMLWHLDYEMPAFFRHVGGQEAFRRRCALCYELRLAETARQARRHGFTAFTTTLLISPYQDQARLHALGEELGRAEGVAFYFENFRRGWTERGRLTEAFGLYRQSYCGCLYSEWERQRGRPLAEDDILTMGNDERL